MRVLAFVGRCLFASLFLLSGAMKLQQFDINDGGAQMTEVSAKLDTSLSTLSTIAPQVPFTATDVQPFYPRILLAAIVLELTGSLLFVLGSAIGAYMLMLFTVSVTVVMHDFWNVDDDEKKMVEMIQFMKNIVIVGALLFFVDMRAQIAVKRR